MLRQSPAGKLRLFCTQTSIFFADAAQRRVRQEQAAGGEVRWRRTAERCGAAASSTRRPRSTASAPSAWPCSTSSFFFAFGRLHLDVGRHRLDAVAPVRVPVPLLPARRPRQRAARARAASMSTAKPRPLVEMLKRSSPWLSTRPLNRVMVRGRAEQASSRKPFLQSVFATTRTVAERPRGARPRAPAADPDARGAARRPGDRIDARARARRVERRDELPPARAREGRLRSRRTPSAATPRPLVAADDAAASIVSSDPADDAEYEAALGQLRSVLVQRDEEALGRYFATVGRRPAGVAGRVVRRRLDGLRHARRDAGALRARAREHGQAAAAAWPSGRRTRGRST